jgi:hypothetical protein
LLLWQLLVKDLLRQQTDEDEEQGDSGGVNFMDVSKHGQGCVDGKALIDFVSPFLKIPNGKSLKRWVVGRSQASHS